MSETNIKQLQKDLEDARGLIKEQATLLEGLANPPLGFGTVMDPNGPGDLVTLNIGGNFIAVNKGVNFKRLKLSAGDGVLVSMETPAIIDKAPGMPLGQIVTIKKVIDKKMAVVQIGGGEAQVLVRESIAKAGLADGDQVILDPTGRVVVYKVESAESTFAVASDTGVTWDNIGGQHEAKQQMIEAIELPLKHPDIFKRYGKKPVKGVLLYGPSGCGKTMLAKAAASSVANVAGGLKGSGFIYVKGPEVLDPYVGVAEATIRNLFQKAREHKAKTGVNAVIFIDEAEALLGKRGSRNANMEKTIVPSFLAEMDGLGDSGAMVILATNHPDALDSAIVREGRIDRKVRVTRPNKQDAEEIFKMNLKGLPMVSGFDDESMASHAVGEIFDENKWGILSIKLNDGKVYKFSLQHLLSGAMVAGIVERATSIALHRDLASGSKAIAGITLSDVSSAVKHVFKSNLDVDHEAAVLEFANNRKIVEVERISYAEVG